MSTQSSSTCNHSPTPALGCPSSRCHSRPPLSYLAPPAAPLPRLLHRRVSPHLGGPIVALLPVAKCLIHQLFHTWYARKLVKRHEHSCPFKQDQQLIAAFTKSVAGPLKVFSRLDARTPGLCTICSATLKPERPAGLVLPGASLPPCMIIVPDCSCLCSCFCPADPVLASYFGEGVAFVGTFPTSVRIPRIRNMARSSERLLAHNVGRDCLRPRAGEEWLACCPDVGLVPVVQYQKSPHVEHHRCHHTALIIESACACSCSQLLGSLPSFASSPFRFEPPPPPGPSLASRSFRPIPCLGQQMPHSALDVW